MDEPLMALPDETATISEWCRPLSSHCCSRGSRNIGARPENATESEKRLDRKHRQRARERKASRAAKMAPRLTDEQREVVRSLHRSGATYEAIAEQFGCSSMTVRRVVHGRREGRTK